MIRILSLKRLSDEDLNFLQQHIVFEIEYFSPFEFWNMPLSVTLNPDKDILIFTSQNAIKSASESIGRQAKLFQCVCIAGKTSSLAEKMGFSVLFSAESAHDLIQKIDKTLCEKRYVHICASDRLSTISEYFKQKMHATFVEAIAYNKKLLTPEVQSIPDILLVFSPSGIDALESLEWDKERILVICIGKTTLNHCIKRGYKKCFAAENPSIRNMLELLIDRIHLVKKNG